MTEPTPAQRKKAEEIENLYSRERSDERVAAIALALHAESCGGGKEGATAWADDVPLRGANMPKDTGQIDWLIQYLLTVRKRFGNTAVHVDGLKWGANALLARADARSQ